MTEYGVRIDYAYMYGINDWVGYDIVLELKM